MGQQNWGTDHLPLVSNILMFNPQDSLGSTLRNLSTLQLLFCLILALVFVYTVFLATVILARLRSLRTVQNDNSSRKSLSLLNHRSANLRQMIVAVFYLFGLMSFLQLQIAFWTPESGRPAAIIVLEYFREYFRFSAVVFLVFLSIHLVQWFVSYRIRTAELRLDAQVFQ